MVDIIILASNYVQALPDGDPMPDSNQKNTFVKLKSKESLQASVKAITFESQTGVKEIKQDGTIINY